MENKAAPAIPRSLFVYSIFYGGMVCIAGVLGAKQVSLGPLAVEAITSTIASPIARTSRRALVTAALMAAKAGHGKPFLPARKPVTHP